MRAELLRRIRAHERSLLLMIEMNGGFAGSNATRFERDEALASEAATRNHLIDWEAPTAPLAVEKLLHLLAHVLVGKIAFDEEALAKIQAQCRGFQSNAKI